MAETVGSDGLPWEATFVENAIRARKLLGMSQTALAKRVATKGLPFHQQTVQRIESGERPVRLNEAVAMAQILMMEDLNEAIHPNTAERATKTLENFIRTAERDWEYTGSSLADLLVEIEAQRENLSAEEAFYRRTLIGIGHRKGAIAGEAEALLDKMWQAQRALQQLLAEHFPADMLGYLSNPSDRAPSPQQAAIGRVFQLPPDERQAVFQEAREGRGDPDLVQALADDAAAVEQLREIRSAAAKQGGDNA